MMQAFISSGYTSYTAAGVRQANKTGPGRVKHCNVNRHYLSVANKWLCVFMLVISMSAISCKEVYEPNIDSPPTGYLVVEGFINNNATAPTTITLSRTTKLIDSVGVLYERNAQVSIEGDNGEVYPLNEGFNGNYSSGILTLNPAIKYRINITTQDGKQYASAFTPVKNTPVIDSVSWQMENGGVQTYVNTHDDQNTTKYYRWKYDETWEIRSAFGSSLKYTRDPVTGDIQGVEYKYPVTHEEDTAIYKCWQSFTSRNIILGTTEKLSTDRIYLPMTYIEPASIKLSQLYSVELKQYALSPAAYLFYQQMKKNTEQLGSIFDAQPSELKGNIECTTNPSEIVIGFVEVSEEQTRRLFIYRKELENWGYYSGCKDIVIDNNKDSIMKYGVSLLPATPKTVVRDYIVDFYASEPFCVDCTLRGTNVRPSFWP